MVLEEVLAKMPPALILLDDEEESPPSEWVSSSAHGEYDPSPAVGGFSKPWRVRRTWVRCHPAFRRVLREFAGSPMC